MFTGKRSAVQKAALAVGALLLLGCASRLTAQTAGLGINPGRLEVEIAPGTEKTVAFEIESPPSEQSVSGRLLLSLTDWSIDPNGAMAYADPGTLPNSASNWIVFSPAAITITSGQKRLVRVTATIPPATVPGVYRTAIFVQERPPATPPKKGEHLMYVRFRYVFTLYLIVGDVSGRGELNGLQIGYSHDQPCVVVEMANDGERHVRPIVSWTISNSEQAEVASLTRYEAMVILPKSKIRQALSIGEDLPPGHYELSAQVDFQDGRPVQSLKRSIELKVPAMKAAETAKTPASSAATVH